MALSSKVGSFDTGTGAAASTVSVSGVGFQPLAVIFWWSGRTGSSDASGSASHQRGIGFATSSTSRAYVANRAEDAQTSSDNSRQHNSDACVRILVPNTDAVDGALDFQSMDADGFTLVVDDQFTASYRVHYWALGGADLTNATTGQITVPGGTGNAAFTGVGFQPDALLLIHAGTSSTSIGAIARLGIGVGVSAAQQAVYSAHALDNAADMVTASYCRAGEIYAVLDASTSAVTHRGQLVSMNADGFTINFTELSSSPIAFYLALKGGRYAVGDLTTATDTSNFSESGLSIGTPVGALFCSACRAADTADTPSVNDCLSLGAASSASDRAAIGTFDENGTATSEVATAVEHDEVYVNVAADDTVQGLMDLVSFDSDGFTVVMDDADPSQNFVWYLAAGSNAGAGGTVNEQTLSSTILLIDEPLEYVFFNRIAEDTLVLTDELVATIVGTVARTLTDTLTITDGANLFMLRHRLLQDTIILSEGNMEQYTTTNIVVDDTLDVIDAIIRYAQFTRLGTDSLVVSDSLISAIVNYVIQMATLSSTISVTDAEQHFVYVTRLAESSLRLFDESLPQLSRFIMLTDTLSVDDSAIATYIPDGGAPGTVFDPIIRIGVDQPRIDLGGYRVN